MAPALIAGLTESDVGHHGRPTTKIGAGAGGATVVIEADPKDDMFAKKLWQLYTRRHNLRR